MEEQSKVKYDNYREQFVRLKKAISNKFYLEAIFIEYVILEDRADSILRYTNTKVKGFGLKPKLNKIEEISREKKAIAHKYFDLDFIQNIKDWIENRNKLMHALMKNTHEHGTIENVAKEGEILVKDLCKKSQAYKKVLIRKNLIQDNKANYDK